MQQNNLIEHATTWPSSPAFSLHMLASSLFICDPQAVIFVLLVFIIQLTLIPLDTCIHASVRENISCRQLS